MAKCSEKQMHKNCKGKSGKGQPNRPGGGGKSCKGKFHVPGKGK